MDNQTLGILAVIVVLIVVAAWMLSTADTSRFTQAWRALQGRFVDNPKGVAQEAEVLVQELMRKRGYPMADFEGRAADISVDHPAVVEHYRAAQAIAIRDQRGEADTEEMRRAVEHRERAGPVHQPVDGEHAVGAAPLPLVLPALAVAVIRATSAVRAPTPVGVSPLG